jgi:superfamily II DNA/RNA helicase
VSNDKRAQVTLDQELNVLIATDVQSEGQNLQDAAIVVNYDLPWAIIRLVQRVGYYLRPFILPPLRSRHEL